VQELWSNNRLRVHHSTMVRVGDYIYGSSGDFGPAPLTAINVKTGEIKWAESHVSESFVRVRRWQIHHRRRRRRSLARALVARGREDIVESVVAEQQRLDGPIACRNEALHPRSQEYHRAGCGTVDRMKIVIGILLAAGIAAAQSPKSDWTNLKKVAAGEEIRVSMSDGKSFRGQLQSTTDESLIMVAASAQQTLARPQIAKIAIKGASHRTRNALIGPGRGRGRRIGDRRRCRSWLCPLPFRTQPWKGNLHANGRAGRLGGRRRVADRWLARRLSLKITPVSSRAETGRAADSQSSEARPPRGNQNSAHP